MPLTVLILVDKFDYHGSYINGPARYYSWVAERIDRSHFRPIVCALRSAGRSDALFRERGIEVRYLGLGRFDPRALLEIVRIVRRERVDVLHLTGYGSTTLGRVAALLCRRPTIVHEHWVDPDLSRLHSLVERAFSLLPGRAIAISDYARRFLIEKKGVRADRIVVIRNGIPLESFREAPAAAGAALRRELGIAQDAPVVGIVGMLHQNKGHRYFLEAAAALAEKTPNAIFVVVGDGELREDLEQRARDLGLGDRLRLLGHQGDMPAVMRMLDIFVMASLSETAPLSLLEAMAAGRAIVTTDCGGPSEIIRDGDSGLVVPVRDPGALASAIGALLEDIPRRQALGESAEGASREFDIDRTVRSLERVYEEAAEEAGSTASQRAGAPR